MYRRHQALDVGVRGGLKAAERFGGSALLAFAAEGEHIPPAAQLPRIAGGQIYDRKNTHLVCCSELAGR